MIESALQRIEEARRRGVIGNYAIGGAIGAMFYMEPFATKDLDVFTLLPVTETGMVSLSAVYDHFQALGCKPEGQFLMIEGVRVEFLPPATPLVAGAIERAVEKKVGQAQTRVFRAEYLAAIMLQTGRRTDLARLERFLEQAPVNRRSLTVLLRRHGLLRKWQSFQKRMTE
ncbi:MAG: hypothetical protein AB1515_06900 [Nitrospirota bacterium]